MADLKNILRVEEGLDDEAKRAWTEGKWRGRLHIPPFMDFLKSLEKPASIQEVEAYIAQVGSTRVEDYLDEDATKAWATGQWKGKLEVHKLLKFLHELGRKATVGDIDEYVANGELYSKKVKELVNERPDSDAKPMACNCQTHRGKPDETSQPFVKNVLERNGNGELVHKKHKSGEEEILEGQFLVNDRTQEIRFYCLKCKASANFRARQNGTMLRWYTLASAQRKLAAIQISLERRSEAADFEQGAAVRRHTGGPIYSDVDQTSRDLERTRNQKRGFQGGRRR